MGFFFIYICVAYFIIKCEQKIPDMKETVCVIYISKIYIYYNYKMSFKILLYYNYL